MAGKEAGHSKKWLQAGRSFSVGDDKSGPILSTRSRQGRVSERLVTRDGAAFTGAAHGRASSFRI